MGGKIGDGSWKIFTSDFPLRTFLYIFVFDDLVCFAGDGASMDFCFRCKGMWSILTLHFFILEIKKIEYRNRKNEGIIASENERISL